jgi:low affinity Fe/Cu permease
MGRRLGSVRLPFAAIGATLAHMPVASGSTALVIVGFVSHVLLCFLWAMALVALVTRGWRLAAAGIVIGCAQLALSWITARVTDSGLGSVLQLGDRLVLAAVIAVSLVVGIRVAVVQNASDARAMHDSSQGETRM